MIVDESHITLPVSEREVPAQEQKSNAQGTQGPPRRVGTAENRRRAAGRVCSQRSHHLRLPDPDIYASALPADLTKRFSPTRPNIENSGNKAKETHK